MSIRTTIDIPEDTYDALRQQAARERTSIRRLVLTAIEQTYVSPKRPVKRLTGPPVAAKGEPGPARPDRENPWDALFS